MFFLGDGSLINMKLLLVILSFVLSQGLKLTDLQVPQEAVLGTTATLSCGFRLDAARLYSVKWYKDDLEFYRFMPDNRPQTQVFPLPGISLDESMSDVHRVTLMDVSGNSTGLYRCEVSTEGPTFETVFSSANMTVISHPRRDPEITIVKTYFAMDEVILANCSSAESLPPAILQWFINGAKATGSAIGRQHESKSGDEYISSLSLTVRAKDVQTDRGMLSLLCEAKVAHLPPRRTAFNISVHPPVSNLKLEQILHSRSNQSQSSIVVLILLFFSVLPM